MKANFILEFGALKYFKEVHKSMIRFQNAYAVVQFVRRLF